MTISRRNFARLAVTSGAAAVASPAIAQGAIKWRLASSFPKSLEGLWGASPTLAKYVSEMSGGKFTIEPFAAGEIVPGLQVLDAVANGTVECGHSYGGYYIGKNPTLIFDGSLPFGMTPRQQNAWYLYGDGKKLMDEVYDGMGVVSIPIGNTGGQTFGWFRKEMKSPADFNGTKQSDQQSDADQRPFRSVPDDRSHDQGREGVPALQARWCDGCGRFGLGSLRRPLRLVCRDRHQPVTHR